MLLFCRILCLWPALSAAQDKPVATRPAADPRLSVLDFSLPARNPRKGVLAEEHLSLFGVQIGRDTLAMVKSRFGARGGTEDEICYSSKRDGVPVWVIFSAGENDTGVLDAFTVLSRAPRMACTPSDLGGGALETRSGIRLGTTLETLHDKLGRPTLERGSYLMFSFELRSTRPDGIDEVVLSGLYATIVNGRVASFRAQKS